MTGGYAPENISFCTYAKLTLMSDEEVRNLKFDILILDEYHRAGAPTWQRNVEMLIEYNKDVPVLGLTATSVRYLDGQRNMADELFDGHMVWDVYDFLFEKFFYACVRYVQTHGDLDVPVGFVDSEGIRLGTWVDRMRIYYRDKNPALTADEIARLDSIGMIWENRFDRKWNKNFDELVRYKEKHGNVKVSATYISESGVRLGYWLSEQIKRCGKNLPKDREQRLRDIGVDFYKPDAWEEKFLLAKEYYDSHDGRTPPSDYKANGMCIGEWYNRQRNIGEGKIKGELTDEQRKKLESIGLLFGKRQKDIEWAQKYGIARSFYLKNNNLNLSRHTDDKELYSLYLWVCRQRKKYRTGKLSNEQIELLRKIGMRFDVGNTCSDRSGSRLREEI